MTPRYPFHSLAIDTSINTMDLIEIFLHKNRMEKQKKGDFLLYMIRVDASHHIVYGKTWALSCLPLLFDFSRFILFVPQSDPWMDLMSPLRSWQ